MAFRVFKRLIVETFPTALNTYLSKIKVLMSAERCRTNSDRLNGGSQNSTSTPVPVALLRSTAFRGWTRITGK